VPKPCVVCGEAVPEGRRIAARRVQIEKNARRRAAARGADPGADSAAGGGGGPGVMLHAG
jgi:hypothetical protein